MVELSLEQHMSQGNKAKWALGKRNKQKQVNQALQWDYFWFFLTHIL